MAQPPTQGFVEAMSSDAQSNHIIHDNNSEWPTKPKSVHSWDTPSAQSHLFYLTENQEQPPHLIPETGQAISIASKDIATWVTENSPHSSTEDNGSVYEALVEIYGVLMETNVEFKNHMIKKAKEKGGRQEAIDELHETWIRSQTRRANEASNYVIHTEGLTGLPRTLPSKQPSVKSEATVDTEEANAKGKAKVGQLDKQVMAHVHAINFKGEGSGTEAQKSGRYNDPRKEASTVISAKGEAASKRHTGYIESDHIEHVESYTEGRSNPIAHNAVNHKKITLIAASKSTKDALKAKGFKVVEIPNAEGSLNIMKRTETIVSTNSPGKVGVASELSSNSPSIIVSGHGNIINVTCASTNDSLRSPTGEIVATIVTIKSSTKEVSPKDISLPSSIPTHASDKSSKPHSDKPANLNTTYISLGSNHSSSSSLRTLRRRTECENLSVAANMALPIQGSTASRNPGEGTGASQAHENMPIPQLPARQHNVSPSKSQAVGNTDPIKRRSTRAPPPPPINTASGFNNTATRQRYFSPEYPVSSNPSLLNSPRTPNMAAYPPLLARTQASLRRHSTAPTNSVATNANPPVFTEAGVAAAVADQVPADVPRETYLKELNTRLQGLELEKARAVNRIWDDGQKIENLEKELEELKARLTWYEAEWRRLASVGGVTHAQGGSGDWDTLTVGAYGLGVYHRS